MKKVNPASVRYQTSFKGTEEVTYDCPDCGEGLKNPLSEAGMQDHCPHCECEFIVPGEEEKRRRAKAREEAKIRAEKEKEAARLRAADKKFESDKKKEEARIRAEKEQEEARIQAENEKEAARLRAEKAREEARIRAEKEKRKRSTHFISLGLMHVLSVVTKSFWIAIWIVVGSIALSVDAIARTGIGVLISIGCFIGVILLVVDQWNDIFAAREAFRDGSDPDKTLD